MLQFRNLKESLLDVMMSLTVDVIERHYFEEDP